MQVFETPNAVMRRYADEDAAVAVWRTEMAPGAAGPVHAIDTDQVLVVLQGRVDVVTDAGARELGPGDGVTLRAGVVRQVLNRGDAPVATLTASLPGAMARAQGRDAVPLPWGR